jgi:hypothetical protein
MSKKQVDLMVRADGSIVQFWPLTRAAKDFFAENVDCPTWARLGNAACVEARYAAPIIEGAAEAGLLMGKW